MALNLEVVFDNGGGITVQCDGFAHNYDNPKQAAADVAELLKGANPATWDGNEPEFRIDWTGEDLRNGGYKVYDADGLAAEMASTEPISVGWHNVDDFLAALTSRAVMEY